MAVLQLHQLSLAVVVADALLPDGLSVSEWVEYAGLHVSSQNSAAAKILVLTFAVVVVIIWELLKWFLRKSVNPLMF